jgi:hypothetical protein
MNKPIDKLMRWQRRGGYLFQILSVIVLGLVLNFYNLGSLKFAKAFADEEPATDTLNSIISTSTISDLTSTDTSTTSIDAGSIASTVSEIIPDLSDSTTTDNPVISGPSPDSTTTDVSSTSTVPSDAATSTATTSEDISTTTATSTDESSATSTDDSDANIASSTPATDESTSTEATTSADISTSTDATTTDATSTDTTEQASTSTEAATTSSDVTNNSTTTEEQPVQTQTQNQDQAVISAVISPILEGTFKSGRIPVLVSFNERVYVSGKPQLILATGDAKTTTVNYLSGSGSRYLIFLYYISAGDGTAHLDYENASALILNGGSIKDSSGTNVNLTLPDPGSASSLSGTTNISIAAP